MYERDRKHPLHGEEISDEEVDPESLKVSVMRVFEKKSPMKMHSARHAKPSLSSNRNRMDKRTDIYSATLRFNPRDSELILFTNY